MNQYIHAESVKLVLSGSDYFDQLSDIICQAKQTIHIQTYIIENDSTGNEIKDKLIDASKRGVSIFFIADAFGSKHLSKEFINDMKSAGIQFRHFSPLFSGEGIYLGRRLHHKIVVADKSTALVGGINMADKYHGTKENPPWLDFAVLIKGDCCEYLHAICEAVFHRKATRYPEKNSGGEGPLIRFRRNDWIRRRNEIHKSYREAIYTTDKSITIIGSYFLPGLWFEKQLRRVSEKGIKVRLIVTKTSDVPFIQEAERFIYSRLLQTGAEIYEWPHSVMHGKAMLVDDEWVSIGSYNINYLSHYRSIELNVDIRDHAFATSVAVYINDILEKHCVKITWETMKKRSGIFQDLKARIIYYFFRVILPVLLPKKRINIL